MGCVTSKKDINDLHPNIFQVSNVDDVGNRISSGQLEVSNTELVLHQKGEAPIRWPLRSLRRYGYDSQVFTFEAGRRCPTGSGIYAFSCRRADRLFNFVQANVQIRNNEDMISREIRTPTPNQTRPSSGYLELSSVTPTSTTSTSTNAGIRQPSLPRLSTHNNPSRLNSVGSSNGCVSPSPPHTINNNYSEFFPGEVTNGAEGAAAYMNVICGAEMIDELEETPIYANLTPGSSEPIPYYNETLTPSPTRVSRNVNYIVLDLDNPSNDAPKSLHPPESPNRPSPSGVTYDTIDFNKTVALSNSANPCFDNEGSRKTRHNSTYVIPGIIGSVRHSASLSD